MVKYLIFIKEEKDLITFNIKFWGDKKIKIKFDYIKEIKKEKDASW